MEIEALSDSVEYEEGEILHDDSELYTPLERPHIPQATGSKVMPVSESDEDNNSKDSSNDSDSSNERCAAKIRRKNHAESKTNERPQRKKYDIWSKDLQADILTHSLVDFNVDKANRMCRDVESYNYKLGITNRLKQDVVGNSNENNTECIDRLKHSGKRKSNGRFVEDKAQKQFENKEKKQNAGTARNILSLSTTIENTEEEIATDIANKLFETKEEIILRALNILGKESVISFFEETREIELSGGMLIMNGTRRRTPGGVFFYLLKTSDSLPRSQINAVFLEDKKANAKSRKQTANELRKIKAARFKETLSKDDFPTLLTRTELAIKEMKAKRLAEESSEVKNPPPSPATDGKDCRSDGDESKGNSEGRCYRDRKFSSENQLTVYDDMFD